MSICMWMQHLVAEDESLVLKVFWCPFSVRKVLTNHVWAGFGCMQVIDVTSAPTGCHLMRTYLYLDADIRLWKWAKMLSGRLEFLIRLSTMTSTQKRKSFVLRPAAGFKALKHKQLPKPLLDTKHFKTVVLSDTKYWIYKADKIKASQLWTDVDLLDEGFRLLIIRVYVG